MIQRICFFAREKVGVDKLYEVDKLFKAHELYHIDRCIKLFVKYSITKLYLKSSVSTIRVNSDYTKMWIIENRIRM